MRPTLVLLFLSLCLPLRADVHPASLFSSNMALQRGQPVPVWGTANPGEKVTVEIAGQTQSTKADATGKWTLLVKPLEAGAGLTMKISGATGAPVQCDNVVVGDVWVCSGQSNMQFALKDAANASTELSQANLPDLRLFKDNHWDVCTPATASTFSAVGYFFAKELMATLHKPMGLIFAPIGGTPIQGWTPEATLRALPANQAKVAEADRNAALQKSDPKAFAQKQSDAASAGAEWPGKMLAKDRGTQEKWFDPATPTDKWDTAKLPMTSDDQGFDDMGTVWYRRTVDLPVDWVGKPLVANIPGCDDVDVTYVNGKEVGRTWYYSVPNFWKVERHYDVPASLVTGVKLTIVVVIPNDYGIGGMFGADSDLTLARKDNAAAPLPLAGEWLMRRGSAWDLSTQPQPVVTDVGGSLYTNAIAPLQPFAIKGVIWYQGENNAGEPDLYAKIFPAMIKSWRAAWGEGNFPFYFVSLAGYMGHQELAVQKGSWAEIREAQKSGLTQPHTGMAMAYDIGDPNNIHPKDKIDVGHRLAAIALANDFGGKSESQGPTFARMKIEGDKAVIYFTHADGLTAKGGELKSFAIAGRDKVFHFAQGTIDGSTVVLTAADGGVPHPIAVRLGWSSIPSANLYNASGFPAVPFKTDRWTRDEFTSQGPGTR